MERDRNTGRTDADVLGTYCPRCGKWTAGSRCRWCGAALPATGNGREAPASGGRVESGTGAGAGWGAWHGRPGHAVSGRPNPGAEGGGNRPLSFFLRFVRFLLDRRQPLWKKAAAVAGIFYILSPLDLSPDLFPLLGWIDDAVVLGLLWQMIAQATRHYDR